MLERNEFISRLLLFSLIGICVFLFIAGYFPQVVRYTRPDAQGTDTQLFPGRFAQDYRVYLSAVTLGQHGIYLFRNPFTTDTLAPLPFYIYYIALGFLTAPFHVSPPIVYHLAQLIAIVLFYSASYYLCFVILRHKAKAAIAAIFGLLATTQPDVISNFFSKIAFVPWWYDWLQAVWRLHQRPHYILAEGFMILALALYIHTRRTRTLWKGWLFSIASLLSTIMVPHTALPIIFVVGCGSILSFLNKTSSLLKTRFIESLSWLFLCLPTIATVFFFRSIAYYDPIWLAYKDWEINFWNQDTQFLYHYYVSFLPLLLLSVLSIGTLIRKRKPEHILLVCWVLAPLLFSAVGNSLGMSKARLLLASIQTPLGILACIGLVAVTKKFSSFRIAVVIFSVFVLYSLSMIGLQIQTVWNSAKNESTNYALIYVPLNYIDAVNAISLYVPKNAGILSGTITGNLIPGFAPVRTFLGHPTQVLHWDEKVTEARRFYTVELSNKDAYKWLQEHDITYVLDDPDMKNFHSGPLPYPFLKEVWKSETMNLYVLTKFSLDE